MSKICIKYYDIRRKKNKETDIHELQLTIQKRSLAHSLVISSLLLFNLGTMKF